MNTYSCYVPEVEGTREDIQAESPEVAAMLCVDGGDWAPRADTDADAVETTIRVSVDSEIFYVVMHRHPRRPDVWRAISV